MRKIGFWPYADADDVYLTLRRAGIKWPSGKSSDMALMVDHQTGEVFLNEKFFSAEDLAAAEKLLKR